MNRAKETFKALKRVTIALVVTGVVLTAISCGKQGNIYGSVIWDPTDLFGYIDGGFPDLSTIVYATSYQTQAGTWNFAYQIYDGTTGVYYPGPTSAFYYTGTYTVSANPGGFFTNGSDNYFQFNCSYSGMVKSGSVAWASVAPVAPPANAAPALSPQLQKQTWTQNGLQITVTDSIATLTPQQLAKVKHAIRK